MKTVVSSKTDQLDVHMLREPAQTTDLMHSVNLQQKHEKTLSVLFSHGTTV